MPQVELVFLGEVHGHSWTGVTEGLFLPLFQVISEEV